ncbi:MFS transporter [Roseimarinus sediminis]|uniref:MFS transporter n=1 Tax=Roseimarinus sediminis TaxID=1610899 RepID=UPI003D1D66C9
MKLNLKTTPFPFKVNQFPFFYGWVILAAGTIGVIMSLPGQTMGVSVFTDYLIAALRIERTSLSLAYLLGTVISGFMITRAGKYYDKYGARVMAMLAGFMLGLMAIGLSKVDFMVDAITRWLGSSYREYIAIVLLVFGFWGIRFFGQGILTMVSRNMVMKWFESHRGLANAIMGVFVSFGFSYAPRLLNDLIEYDGWRAAWGVIGLFVGIVFVIFALVFFRDNARDCGVEPDGKLGRVKNKLFSKKAALEKEFTLKQAQRKYSFWVFNLGIALNALFVTAFTFHVVSIFKQAGFDRESAIAIFLPASFIAVVFNFVGGWISDYIRLKYLLIINMVGIAIAGFALTQLNTANVAYYLLIVGNGIMSGLFSVINTVSWPRFFGVKHLGAISGYSMSWTVIASALGPYLFSLSLKYSGSYTLGSIIVIALALTLMVLGLKANNVEAEAA